MEIFTRNSHVGADNVEKKKMKTRKYNLREIKKRNWISNRDNVKLVNSTFDLFHGSLIIFFPFVKRTPAPRIAVRFS